MAQSSLVVLNGQIGLFPSRTMAAAAGKYYTASNPTPGTGVQYPLQTAFSATANGLFTIANANPAASGVNVQLDFIALMMIGAAPTATTVMKINHFVDTGVVTPSAGNAAVTPVNVNTGFANTSNATINSFTANAAMTIPATAAVRRAVGSSYLPTSLGITGDTYLIRYGNEGSGTGAGGTAVRSAAPATIVADAPPIVLGPGTTYIADMYWLTQATAGGFFEFLIGYFEA